MTKQILLGAAALIAVAGPALAAKADAPTESLLLKVAQPIGEAPLDPIKKLPASKNVFAKAEAKIAANDKLILEEAKLSDDKESFLKADQLVESDQKLLRLADKTGPDPKVLERMKEALKTQAAIQTALLAEDRKVELKRDDADIKADAYTVAILPHLGAVLALPTKIENAGFWKEASGSGNAVIFYDDKGVDFKVAPEDVLKLDEMITETADRNERNPDAFLKESFGEAKPLYEKFGEAGLLADLLAIQPYAKAAGYKADVRAIDRLIVDFADHGRGGVAAVPEPATWALMLVGIGGMGAALRRRSVQARAA